MWQSKINENDIFGLDGWDAVDSTINKTYEIMSKYTGKWEPLKFYWTSWAEYV